MKITENLADTAVLAELGRRVAHRRVEAGLTQDALARESGVSKRTVERLEAGNSVQLTSLVRVLRMLGLLGKLEALLPPAVPGPMELLERGRARRRVRHGTGRGRARDSGRGEWTWGDDT
ncbi:MAG TPA: helix-turn-helix domain-containing protein [Gammaproteobacteria bacterium]